MSCPKFISVFFLVVAFVTLQAGDIFALTYTSLALSPDSGIIYSSETPISINVDSGFSEFQAIQFTVNFPASIQYANKYEFVSSACGASSRVIASSSSLDVECIVPNLNSTPIYSGKIVTLYFKSHTAGTATITLSDVDPTATTVGSGTYTVDLTESDLPDAGLFDDSRSIIILGVIFVLFGVFFNYVCKGVNVLKYNAKEYKSKTDERKVEKRRSKLEDKF